MRKKNLNQSGFTLIEILVVLAVLIIALAGGMVVWEKKSVPTSPLTPSLTPSQTIQPTPFSSSPGINDEIQTKTPCNRESGIDTYPRGYVCHWSWECPKGIQDCGSPTGDFLCHKKCQTDSDCPSSMPFCKELSLFRGDFGEHYRMCMK